METNQRHFNRGSVPTGYDIDNSLKLEADNSEQLSRDVSSAGSRTTATVSMWIKRTELGVAQYLFTYGNTDNDDGRTFARFQADDILRIMGGSTVWRDTNRVFRDTSAWYHIVIAFDTTQSTANDRIKLYVNGVQETSFSTTNNPSEDGLLGLNFQKQVIGYNSVDGGSYFSGYMTEIVHQDGTASAPTEFGEFDEDSGTWKPKDVSGVASGTNGFYLDFEDSSNMGNDASGGTDFTETNIAAADQATDTPTNNFCTFNPLINQNNSPTISEGAMKSTGSGAWNQTWGSLGVQNGKWYYEFKVTNTSSSGYFGASTAPAEGSYLVAAQLMYNTSFITGNPARVDYYYWQSGSQTSNESTGWGTISTDDIIGIALDLDASTKTFTVYKNGTALSGTLSQPVNLPTNMQDEFVFPLYVQYSNLADEANFGGYTLSSISSAAADANGYGTFEIAPPSGYYALCTKNIAEFG
tara:strand:+ start:1506 stop:2909 length:1404 start_codon:yes stop_codon:yes gene_type:complete